MPEISSQHGLERNIRLYPYYAFTFNAFAWMPVFFLYFSKHMSLENVLRLEAIYYAAVVLLEVPSGYFSDRVGRRITLLISAAAFVASYILFLIAGWQEGFAYFAAAQVLLAAGISFNSGTDTSFHYDSLQALGREKEFDDREAVVARNGFLAGAVSALAGGFASTVFLGGAYAVSLLAAVGSLGVLLLCTEPATHREGIDPNPAFLRQIRDCLGVLRKPKLAWLFAFALLMVVLNHVPYEFYQPYLDLLTNDSGIDWLSDRSDPAILGVMTFVIMVSASWIAARSIRLRDRLGIAGALITAAALQTIIILSMGAALHVLILALILLRTLPRALMTAPLNAAIAPLVDRRMRATYLSVQSLAGRLAFSATLMGLSFLGDGGVDANWDNLRRVLLAAGAIGVVGVLLLIVSIKALGKTNPPSE